MADNLSYFLNRAFDVAGVVSFIVKTFTIYVIVFHTPKKMRHFSNLLLNGLLWNFIGNLLFSLARPIPLFPAECGRIDGILSSYLDTHFIVHLFIKLAVLTIINTGLATLMCFQFRCMDVVHSHRFSKLHPVWGYLYCLLAHIAISAVYIVLYDNWSVPVSAYPDPMQLPVEQRLICYKPNGLAKNLAIGWFFPTVFVMLLFGIFFSMRSFKQLNRKHSGMHEQTIVMQRRLLRNLIYLTAVPVFAGGIPTLVIFACLYFTELPEGKLICAVSMVILLNHGAIYSITTLVVFKDYRKATRRRLLDVVSQFRGLRTRLEKISNVWAQASDRRNSH